MRLSVYAEQHPRFDKEKAVQASLDLYRPTVVPVKVEVTVDMLKSAILECVSNYSEKHSNLKEVPLPVSLVKRSYTNEKSNKEYVFVNTEDAILVSLCQLLPSLMDNLNKRLT